MTKIIDGTKSQKPKYCTLCGKELHELPPITINAGFDPYTGEKITWKRIILICRDFIEGYSDKEYEIHDRNYFDLPIDP